MGSCGPSPEGEKGREGKRGKGGEHVSSGYRFFSPIISFCHLQAFNSREDTDVHDISNSRLEESSKLILSEEFKEGGTIW